jgi:hypothetical protein
MASCRVVLNSRNEPNSLHRNPGTDRRFQSMSAMLAVQKSWNQPTHPVDRKLSSQPLAKQHVVAPVLKSAATLFQEISAVFQEFNATTIALKTRKAWKARGRYSRK